MCNCPQHQAAAIAEIKEEWNGNGTQSQSPLDRP